MTKEKKVDEQKPSSTENCKICASFLSSSTELKVVTCIDCISTMSEEIKSFKEKEAEHQRQEKERVEQLSEVYQRIEAMGRLIYAEKMGHEAGMKGLGDDECPWKANNIQHDAWMKGFWNQQLIRDLRKAEAVMLWSVGTLEHVHELATGYNQSEIADKVSMVAKKLGSYASTFQEAE